MRTHTNEFKEELKVFGRQIKGKITYYPSYYLISEEEDNILTETDLQIISEQANYEEPIEINEEDIFSISIIKNGDLLQSLMKEFDFESKIELNIGSVVNPQFGLLVDEDYEYLDYGNYIINSKEFNMDTETWSYVCYDKMLFSMVKYRGLSNVEYPITIKQFIDKLCNKVGLEFEESNFVNQGQLIYEDLYKNRDVTYRDIFDEISKIVAGNLLINDNDKLEVGYPNKIGYSENASGSNITIEAVEEPISDVKLEGDTQQEGTPTPSNPQNVEVITGEQNIEIVGKNLLYSNLTYPFTINGVTVTKEEDGSITLNGTQSGGAMHIIFNNEFFDSIKNYVGKEISISLTTNGEGSFSNFGIKNGTTTDLLVLWSPSLSKTQTLNLNNYTNIYFDIWFDNNSRTFVNYNIKPQVEVGNATTYEPYQSQNYPINLGNIELCKIGDYQDYIYNQNGDWYLHKEIGKVILNGGSNESYAYQNNHRFWLRRSYWTNETVPFNPPQNALQGLYCNRFTEKTRGQTWGGIEGISYDNPNTVDQPIGSTFDIACNSVATTESNFKTWLSNNPLEVVYILQNTQDTQITDATLIQQLDNLKNAILFNGVNNISTSGNLPSILNLDYISEYESINEDYLKDTNVRMSERIGVINSVAILDSDNNLQYIAEDTQSIKENEMTRITITDNLIALNGETQDIADNILNKLNGFYYYANDLQTTGVCYYDFLDMFNIEARGNIYQCLLLNNEITITQGIEEHIFTEKFEELETSANEYTTSVISNKAVQFKINQQEGKIESKVEKDGVISAINQSAEEIQINANKLSFEGATINMTADNVKIKGENLDIDSSGVITLTDNSAASSLSDETLHSAYIIKSTDTVERAGTIETLNFINQIVANGRKITLEDNWEYQETTGGGKAGIIEGVYSQPRLTFYSQSNDFESTTGNGSYQDLDISLNAGIKYTNIQNGTTSTPLIITPSGNITCVSLTQTSKEENKKNFEKLINAKDILNKVDIYKYNYINEDNKVKKSIGFVIGDDFNYSEEITSTNNDGANIYSMVSVLWQVVKEQQEEINELKEMIKNGKY